jgi:hypothetical protein
MPWLTSTVWAQDWQAQGEASWSHRRLLTGVHGLYDFCASDIGAALLSRIDRRMWAKGA